MHHDPHEYRIQDAQKEDDASSFRSVLVQQQQSSQTTMSSKDSRRTSMDVAFGPHLSHQEAIRKLTALSTGCTACAADMPTLTPAGFDRAQSQPIPKLRHYSVPLSIGQTSPMQMPADTKKRPISPSSISLGSPPSSPLISFWGAYFDKRSPGTSPTTSVFMKKERMVVPKLGSDIDDMTL